MWFTYLSLLDSTSDLGVLLGYTPDLCSLHFKSLFNTQPTLISSICALFQNLNGPLQCLTIDLLIVSDNIDLWAKWAVMNELFREQKFSLLERVVFNLVSVDNVPIRDDAGELLSRQLPFLHGSGKLIVRRHTGKYNSRCRPVVYARPPS